MGPAKLMRRNLNVSGIFNKWCTNDPSGRLVPVPATTPGTALLRYCVRMASDSFSFMVVEGGKRGYDDFTWRLYPRDAVPIKLGFIKSHVSKEGMLTSGDPNAVPVGRGDLKVGHGLNFHVLEKKGTVVTIWVEVPAIDDGGPHLDLNTSTADKCRVWYTKEDNGIQQSGGDMMDLSKYRKWLPPGREDMTS